MNVDEDDVLGAGPLSQKVRARRQNEGMDARGRGVREDRGRLRRNWRRERLEMLGAMGLDEPALGKLAPGRRTTFSGAAVVLYGRAQGDPCVADPIGCKAPQAADPHGL